MKDKKILILGGISLSNEITKYAKRLGLSVYVTDYLEDSPAKKNADKSFMESTTDVEAISKLINKEKIDGVITGFVDMLLPFYVDICHSTSLPCFPTKSQIDILTDKDRFKNLCREHGIPVVEEYKTENPLDEKIYRNFKYPVILKPADNSGGKGITICNNYKEFVEKYNISLSFSKIGKVLIERYMNAKEVTIFYVIQNGKVKLTAMGDRHVKHFQNGLIPLPVAYSFPSIYLEEYEKNIHPKTVSLFESLDMKNGMVFIQSFIENGKCIFYEMGYRLTGSLEYKIIEHACGFNPMDMAITHAVNGRTDVDLDKLANPHFKKHYCNITFLAKPGKIGKITPKDKILAIPNVIDIFFSYEQGDIIPKNALGTLAQVVARVFAYAETKEELAILMEKIHSEFDVLSEEGKSILLPTFNVNEL